MQIRITLLTAWMVASTVGGQAAPQVLWQGGRMQARLVPPNLAAPMDRLVETTINGYLDESCGRTIPVGAQAEGDAVSVLVGDEQNNPAIGRLVAAGLDLGRADLGDEGFRLLTHEADGRKSVIITANTPAGLKYGCQELVFFHTALTSDSAAVDWPLDTRRKPGWAYRGIYMLPCWSAHDSIANWRAVLKFNSELTLNRNWFWLGGFPVMEQYGGEYKGTDLANVQNVRGLIDLCRSEAMKFYVGDGWFTWHHAKAVKGDPQRGIQYYLDLVDLLPGTEGIYLEPVGEGSDAKEEVWRPQAAGIHTLAEAVWKKHPDLEFAVAIGKFNNPAYRKLIHEIDDGSDSSHRGRLYWWWCWGDPLKCRALDEHPLVLRWHTTVHMSDFHGSTDAPRPDERPLTGFATSYDPGQGYGNPWNGWGKLGFDKARNVHPRTMPFFSHQYRFRERCWDAAITDDAFARRLSCRLFDADMPADSIQRYLELAAMCSQPRQADLRKLLAIEAFVNAHQGKGTARNRDTLTRMAEAVAGIRAELAKPPATRPK
ncbi:MAG: hypothetical protein HY718_19645 [Planctomycetes bacterium]|nr:hypothetical protein [Planctomycetota bacterium]